MKEVSAAESEPFHLAVRAILIEDPSAIERLSPPDAARIDALLDANGLEPLLFDTARREGTAALLSPERESAWKTAWLMASGRWAAYRSGLEELREIASAREMEVQVAGSAAFSLRVYPHPELRPIEWIECGIDAERADELRSALAAWRWSEIDTASGASALCGGVALCRDGVEIRIETLPLLENPGPPEYLGAGLFGPGLEALCVLNAAEMARRRYARSLTLLLDMTLALADSRVTAGRVARLAAKNHLEVETALALELARDVLGVEMNMPAPPAGEEMREEWRDLRDHCKAMILRHPADTRVQAAIEEGLRAIRVDHRVTG